MIFKFQCKEPDKLVEWCQENIAPGSIIRIVAEEYDESYLVYIILNNDDDVTAAKIKLFWSD